MEKKQLIVSALVCLYCVSAQAGFGDLLDSVVNTAEKIQKIQKKQEGVTQDDNNNNANSDTSGNTADKNQRSSKEVSRTTAAPAIGGQPNLVATKIDFVPGEKTVFFDNFHDMPPGEPPPHWKVRGGHVDLLVGGGVRALSIPAGVNLTTGSLHIPADFTMQAVFVPKPGFNDASGFLGFEFRNKEDNNVFSGKINVKYTSVSLDNDLGTVHATYEVNKPNEFDLWSQQGRVRVYLNGTRLIDVNQVHPGAMDHLYLEESQGTFELRSIRIAESAPDPGDVLATTGKYVTHGILFDTDSDILKPESAGVIKEISTALYKHPELKVEIDGYTDSSGNASHNMDLSKRRAEAVMNVLVAQFGLDQSRLTAAGFGSKNPISSNNTPEGRAQNRRVEFVRL
jgi:outer membrane protein OmpA-like peptidoglycan-associated protein